MVVYEGARDNSHSPFTPPKGVKLILLNFPKCKPFKKNLIDIFKDKQNLFLRCLRSR